MTAVISCQSMLKGVVVWADSIPPWMQLCGCVYVFVLDWHVSAAALTMLYTCRRRCARAATHTRGLIFISLVCRRLLADSLSCSASLWVRPGGQPCVCVWRTCWYVLFTHACLSVSWGCGICTVEVSEPVMHKQNRDCLNPPWCCSIMHLPTHISVELGWQHLPVAALTQ